MKHLKQFESFKEFMSKCWHSAKIGDTVPESDVYQYVEKLHRNDEDFIDGDLPDRIQQFESYTLMEIKISDINIDEYYLDEDYMKSYMDDYESSKDYPPIVLDGDTQWSYANNYTIIDGTHRVNALHQLGHKTILAWVGTT